MYINFIPERFLTVPPNHSHQSTTASPFLTWTVPETYCKKTERETPSLVLIKDLDIWIMIAWRDKTRGQKETILSLNCR
ncbi:hypothetical protein Bpfe_008401, partial [Biomphalaria pfeifferi]